MKKRDCKHCVCLTAKNKDGTGEWICDEIGKRISDINKCPEGITNTDIKNNSKRSK